jgi:hypothetical protein
MGVNLARHVYEYDKIVVGSSLRAMLYAYYNGLPIVFTKISRPTLIDYFEPEICLAGIGMENKIERIVSTNGESSRGIQKLEAWKRLSLLLSLSGLMPLSDKAESIRVEGNSLRIVLGMARMAVFEFNKLILFDDDNLSNIYPKEEKNPRFKVLDWVDVKSGMSHSFDAIHTEDDFVKEIVFYKSLRIMGTKRLKDLVSVSYLSGDNLSNFEYSDTYARFKTSELMKKAGIRGTRNGRDVKNPEKYKYYALKLESDRREVFPDFFHTWEHSDSIEGNYMSESEIISSHSGSSSEYLRMLSDKI